MKTFQFSLKVLSRLLLLLCVVGVVLMLGARGLGRTTRMMGMFYPRFT